ncbi:MAG: A/G-specific adenine glycosylase [Nocardioidaceae bacterium]|nr:A/G-specific adenine glycosylase [Nocardioidaceae bacterium]
MTKTRSDDPILRVTEWYACNARDLPWRRPGTSPWGVLVSEFMLQQTPVGRVLPLWQEWLGRWPSASDLAAEPAGEAVRAWGRLGYPRRALRLHACAAELVTRHAGLVPVDAAQLQSLPGVGAYTAAAVASFAHGQRVAVLDTNVRRMLARLFSGTGQPTTTSPGRAEQDWATRLLPADPASSARWSVAVMELGALVCTSRAPRCGACPVADQCAWLARGRPSAVSPPRRQTYAGTDRQCRGRLLAILRNSEGPVPSARLGHAWPDPDQRARALDSLVADGLAEALAPDSFALPGTVAHAYGG